jgi:chorismate mutase
MKGLNQTQLHLILLCIEIHFVLDTFSSGFSTSNDLSWLTRPGKKVLMSGPCSAESAGQLMTTAKGIAARFPNNILRAGIWKPRTRPGTFEGMGEVALEWLRDVKKETGMRVAIEVATTKHVDLALRAGVDILWIGARTTGNPFHVQELAESLKGIDIPVFVKNPLHPDIQLWIGGLERFHRAGITKLGAIHRGFHAYENSGYRNVPRWQIVHSLKSLYPGLPVICDISHIAGHRDYLAMIAQQAYDLNLEGLMIETHCDPSSAMSDPQQQITPDELGAMVNKLLLRRQNFEDTSVMPLILEIRERIDEIDRGLLELLTRRMSLAGEIGELKRDHNVSILQLQRWQEIIDNCMAIADEKGLNREFVKNVLIQIHDEAIRLQSKILKEAGSVRC